MACRPLDYHWLAQGGRLIRKPKDVAPCEEAKVVVRGSSWFAARTRPPEGGRSLVEVAGIEPASKKRDMEGRYRLGPNRVTSAGDRTTLIEDLSPGLGCRQETSRQPILSHRPVDRSHPFSGLTSPVPGDPGDSPVTAYAAQGSM